MLSTERQTLGGIERERERDIYIYIYINYTSFRGNYQSHTLSTTTTLAKLAYIYINI